MININNKHIFLVDDDAVHLRLLEIEFLQQTDYAIETFKSGELCIKALDKQPDIIVLDYWLDGIEKSAMNGIEVLDVIKTTYPNIPVIMLSSQDKIEVAINCMHHKAFDYVVKSETSFMKLTTIINHIFNVQKLEHNLNWYKSKM